MPTMHALPQSIPDVLLITPEIFPDDRGMFFESYNESAMQQLGINDHFIQDNVSISKNGVLRGLHYQTGAYAQSKLVSVSLGKVYDVAVDLRKESPTYGRHVSVILDDQQQQMLFIPRGFAHGFYVLSNQARFHYKVAGAPYVKEAATGIRFDDPTLAIPWPITGTPCLSAQDACLPLFS